ncbi:ubiquinone/menaquinone biosynthesis C-methylase UbiE [Pseudorhizobium tarimense]|uniref:Ubiquinone/menaquinone biosynthesis C-methylase UbiE n=1 Tax=Pseudorhizobium tarimense TaxID=1079109 RepID=A0ABV2HBG0_9HYPH
MTGLDIAPTLLRHARKRKCSIRPGIDYVIGDGVTLPFADGEFDLVVAFMSMMDMADQAAVLKQLARVLKRGGFLQFSILHPCFVPPTRRNIRNQLGEAVAVEVADYFDETQGRIGRWIFSAIPRKSGRG